MSYKKGNHREEVKKNIEKKFQNANLPLVDEVYELDKKFREAKSEGDALRAEKNKTSSMIGELMKEGKKEEAEEAKNALLV